MALTNEQFAHAVKHEHRLLVGRLDCDEAHPRVRDRSAIASVLSASVDYSFSRAAVSTADQVHEGANAFISFRGQRLEL